MTERSPAPGSATALVLVAVVLVAIPAGLAAARGLSVSGAQQQALPTVTPPSLSGTATDTPTSTPTGTVPQGGNGTTHVVNDDGGSVGGGLGGGSGESGSNCSNPDHTSIQAAVGEAKRGDTVLVCAGQYNSVEIGQANLTLRAEGNALIESTELSAVKITAPRVTVRGFTVTGRTEYLIAVGGRDSLVRNNTVEVKAGNYTGIFLSDGRAPETGEPDPEFRAATGSRVLNNTITITDQPGEQQDPTQSGDDEQQVGVFTDADQTVVRGNDLSMDDDYATAIRSSGNRTLITRNRIFYPTRCQGGYTFSTACSQANYPPAILLVKRKADAIYNLCAQGSSTGKLRGHQWARQNRVVNNTVSDAPGYGLYVGTSGNHTPVTEGLVVRGNRFESAAIGGWVSYGLFKNNTIRTETLHQRDASERQDNPRLCVHFTDSRFIGNRIDIQLQIQSGRNLTVQRNTITKGGIRVIDLWYQEGHPASDIRIINNTISDGFYSGPATGIKIETGANVSEIAYNRITNNSKNGVSVGDPEGCSVSGSRCPITAGSFHHNTIRNNEGHGVTIAQAATVNQFHNNRIFNNDQLGIYKLNFDKSDDYWPVVNATRNYWGCGGPSGGLQDPVTNRIANGSGDAISAGDEAGMSNVHFDPFYVLPGLTCPAMADPTPAPSPTPTRSPTPTQPPTPTPTATATPTALPGPGNGTGSGGTGNGTGGTGNGSDGGEGQSTDDPAGTTVSGTPPPTEATPTPTPTPPISPTPRVEPGFGVVSWLLGTIVLVAGLGLRRRLGWADRRGEDGGGPGPGTDPGPGPGSGGGRRPGEDR